MTTGINHKDCLLVILQGLDGVHDDEKEVDRGPGQEEHQAHTGQQDVGPPLPGRLPLVSGAGGQLWWQLAGGGGHRY